MLISDERSACAIIVRDAERRTEARLFDDINCLVLHETTGPALDVGARWVHDYETLAWIAAEHAHYVLAPSLNTPMMSHVAAYGDRPAAEAAERELDGELYSFDGIRFLFTPGHLREERGDDPGEPGTPEGDSDA